MNATEKFFTSTNYKLLRRQKLSLINIIESDKLTSIDRNNLTGILHMIDNIQDIAVDHLNYDEIDVFGKTYF